ncbi:MAG: hypothetical protein Q7J38_07740 [Gallionella sp.]|nr:hypothetical protein [Gallionella sp.]
MEKSRCTPQVTAEYRVAVTALATNKENRRFLNDSCEHAKLLADLMIGCAQNDDETVIYSGELGKDCFENALVSSQGKVRILLDNKSGNEIINSLPENVKARIEVRMIKHPCDEHFFVSGNSFRYETDHEESTAVANFNEPETAIKLKALFNNMWDQAIGI